MSLDRRITSNAFIAHEVEEECRERGLQWRFLGEKDQAMDIFLEEVERLPSSEIYVHKKEDCSELCKKRGVHLQYTVNTLNIDIDPSIRLYKIRFCQNDINWK